MNSQFEDEVIRIQETDSGAGVDGAVVDRVREEAESAPDLTNRSVLRAMSLLSELGNHTNGATAAELASAIKLPRPTAYRLLLSMAHAGMIVNTDGKFSLGWEIARLGRLADPRSGLQPHIQVYIDRLSTDLNESIGYAVATGPTTLDLIAEADSPHMLSSSQKYVGRKLPLHASSTGKVLLANLTDDQVVALLPSTLQEFTRFTITDRALLLRELGEVRARGYATIDNELEEGLFSVAVPVHDGDANLIGAISASGLDQRMKAASVHTFIERLQRASTEISTIIRGL